MQKFLESHPEFVLEKPNVTFGRPAYGVDAVRIFPMDGGEGHFAARFRRVAPCEERFAPFSFKPDRETQRMPKNCTHLCLPMYRADSSACATV